MWNSDPCFYKMYMLETNSEQHRYNKIHYRNDLNKHNFLGFMNRRQICINHYFFLFGLHTVIITEVK